jgi:predicted nucleic acid-binding protein
VIVVDTSAWIELFHARTTPVAATLEHLIGVQADVAITETILMEVLAGAAPGEALARIRAERNECSVRRARRGRSGRGSS